MCSAKSISGMFLVRPIPHVAALMRATGLVLLLRERIPGISAPGPDIAGADRVQQSFDALDRLADQARRFAGPQHVFEFEQRLIGGVEQSRRARRDVTQPNRS